MRFSRYTRRAKRYGSGRILSRLAARLAPTQYQSARALKQQVRAEIRQADPMYARGFELFRQKWAANPALGPLDEARARTIYGKGGYFGRVAGRYLGGLADQWFGNHRTKFAETGAALGDQAGEYLASKIPFGHAIADYAKPIAQDVLPQYFAAGEGAYTAGDSMDGVSSMPMSFMDGEVDSVRIKKKEYLGAIAGSDVLALRSLVVNAGDPATFPSLSRHAMNFEQYKMHGLIFWFKSTSGESTNSANTNIGEIIMCSVSDSQEPLPINKQQLLDTDKPVTAKPSVSSCYGFECADSSVLRIRHGDPNESTGDNTSFDLGRFFIACEGANLATTRVGELWVSYDCTLIRSRDPRGLETLAHRAVYPAAVNSNLFSSVPAVAVNSLRLTLAGNTLTFPQFLNDGTFMVIIKCIGSVLTNPAGSIVCIAPFPIAGPNLQVINQRVDFAGSGGVAASCDGVAIGTYVVRINAPNATTASMSFGNEAQWQIAGGGGATTGVLEIDVYRIPDVAY